MSMNDFEQKDCGLAAKTTLLEVYRDPDLTEVRGCK